MNTGGLQLNELYYMAVCLTHKFGIIMLIMLSTEKAFLQRSFYLYLQHSLSSNQMLECEVRTS